jgi:hypothetical protein
MLSTQTSYRQCTADTLTLFRENLRACVSTGWLVGNGPVVFTLLRRTREPLANEHGSFPRGALWSRGVPIGELVGTSGLRLPVFTDKQTVSEPDRTSLEGTRADSKMWASRKKVTSFTLTGNRSVVFYELTGRGMGDSFALGRLEWTTALQQH